MFDFRSFPPKSSRITIVCIPNHLHPVVHVNSNIWYEFQGSQRLGTGLFRKWKAENGRKIELTKTTIENEVQELQERSSGKKSLGTIALFSLWSYIRSCPSFFWVSPTRFSQFSASEFSVLYLSHCVIG